MLLKILYTLRIILWFGPFQTSWVLFNLLYQTFLPITIILVLVTTYNFPKALLKSLSVWSLPCSELIKFVQFNHLIKISILEHVVRIDEYIINQIFLLLDLVLVKYFQYFVLAELPIELLNGFLVLVLTSNSLLYIYYFFTSIAERFILQDLNVLTFLLLLSLVANFSLLGFYAPRYCKIKRDFRFRK